MLPPLFQECRPIATLEDLESVLNQPPAWISRIIGLENRSPSVVENKISDCHSEWGHYSARKRHDRRLVPKTLVCHDYKGGYLDDRFLYYGDDITGNGYTFYNWAQIDIFVYFSHHFITIPPLCWINTAHTNGVQILGTLITENVDGKKNCERIFSQRDTMRNFARNLVTVTELFNLDGWLLNIENVIEPTILENFKAFIVYFTHLIHKKNSKNLVIWYDSVVETGSLKWQNELNLQNSFFFNACDGIFLNYTWTEKHLINSVEAAKHRNLDVFVGIDVFGRNTFGGGMFNCYKAAELIRKYNLSMAIFAPGWTHETLTRNDEFFEVFLNRDSAFWSCLWPYLYTHPITKKFETNFYIGLDNKHYNLFNQKQQLSQCSQPQSTTAVPHAPEVRPLNLHCKCIQCDIITDRNTCLITNKHLSNNLKYVHHLFLCDIAIEQDILIFFTTKSTTENPYAKLTVTLLTCNESGAFRKIILLNNYKVNPISNSTTLEVNRLDEQFLHNLHLKHDINSNAYRFESLACRIFEIGATIEEGTSINLCSFGIRSVPN